MYRRMKRTLIAGVGYGNLTDLSVGPIAIEELSREQWPDHVDVEDLSIGAVHAVHWLTARTPLYERVVFVAAADRGFGRPRVRYYRWNGELPSDEEIQARVAEAVMGVVDLDSMLVVTQHFDALPPEVYVIEVQPLSQEFGIDATPEVRALLPEIRRLARRLAEEPSSELGLPSHVRPTGER